MATGACGAWSHRMACTARVRMSAAGMVHTLSSGAGSVRADVKMLPFTVADFFFANNKWQTATGTSERPSVRHRRSFWMEPTVCHHLHLPITTHSATATYNNANANTNNDHHSGTRLQRAAVVAR